MSMAMYTGSPVGPAFVASAFVVTEEDADHIDVRFHNVTGRTQATTYRAMARGDDGGRSLVEITRCFVACSS